jgi:hypothetical protein
VVKEQYQSKISLKKLESMAIRPPERSEESGPI